jgi:seryl-tRNA(Sec) selenium transferase
MVKIPRRLDELLPAMAMERLLDVLQQPDLSNKVREAMNKVGLRDATPLDKVKVAWQQARSWLDSLTESHSELTDGARVLNATGQLLHPRFAAVPSTPSVAYGYAKSAANYQLKDAIHFKVERTVEQIFGQSSGSSRVILLSSIAETLRLLGCSERSRDGIVISRADSVRIPGVGDVRAMLEHCVHPLLEIGAANGVSGHDWTQALTSANQLLVLSSPNNLLANESAYHRTAAVAAARSCGACVVELLADGVLNQTLSETFGFSHARQRLEQGAHLVVLPLNLLIGGPCGVLVAGEPDLVNWLQRKAESIGMTLASPACSAATIALQTNSLGDELELGLAAPLLVNQDNLKNRARRMAVQLSGLGEIAEASEVSHRTPLGPTPWNRYELTSWAVRLQPKNSIELLAKQFQADCKKVGLCVETASEDDALLLNLRFIPPENDHDLVAAFAGKEQFSPLTPTRDPTPGE